MNYDKTLDRQPVVPVDAYTRYFDCGECRPGEWALAGRRVEWFLAGPQFVGSSRPVYRYRWPEVA